MTILSHERSNVWIIVLLLGVNVAAGLAIVFALNYLHDQQLDHAKRETQNLSLAVDQSIRHEIGKLDLSLRTVIGQMQDHTLKSGQIDRRAIQNVIDHQKAIIPEANIWTVSDADGNVILHAAGNQPRPVLSDREYFIDLKSGNKTGLVITKPLIGRVTGKWEIILARAYQDNAGHFAGVILTSLSVSFLERLISEFKVEPRSILVLRDKELGLIARWSPNESQRTYVVGDTNTSEELKALIDKGLGQATYKAVSVYDPVERIFTYRLIGEVPMYAVVGVSTDDYLAEWYQLRNISAGFLAFFLALTNISTSLLYRKWRRQLQAEQALRKSERQFRSLAENTPDCIARYSIDGRLAYMNPSCIKITGRTLADIENAMVFDCGPPGYAQKVLNVARTGVSDHLDESITLEDGRILTHHIRFIAECDEIGKPRGVLAIGRDITERKEMEKALRQHEEQLQHIAYHDALTGLPNRILLTDRLNQGIANALRSGEKLAVAYLDLDKFKPINDTFGHEVGDQVLKTVAERMRGILRAVDTVARIGGDEFVLLLVGQTSNKSIGETLNRVLEAIATPVVFADYHFQLSASIGVSLYPEHDVDPDILLRNADQSMYAAKQLGRNQCVFHGQRN
ncbi:bifunctional diguanylate cyclase/phosphodiesterase [Propionivibrio dicarboxylicus]|uniref:PAS domain S-box-containing protein/diguanylate cyclase (GGDEF) domain-containing protein n=1 Tax=Propionivibrio dicarboxylicus TaxID=83767 RepID=A0A1G8ANT9_9RHOO|nr:diguanylate cyclase [Propionivibrio dicarboxylicus]SDH22523.1 PAS domain S-box-containing protein/diguanylate cyclase (GGDEF) domain-containing protein [Propionivibrio dicarboxylicus]